MARLLFGGDAPQSAKRIKEYVRFRNKITMKKPLQIWKFSARKPRGSSKKPHLRGFSSDSTPTGRGHIDTGVTPATLPTPGSGAKKTPEARDTAIPSND